MLRKMFFSMLVQPKGLCYASNIRYSLSRCHTPGWKSLDSGDLENSINDINRAMHLVLNSRLRVFKPQSAREWRHSIGEILGKGGKSNYFRLF